MSTMGPAKAFKEKYVSMCEHIFTDPSSIQHARVGGIQGRTALARFWDELLLLKVNQKFLAECISSRTEEELRSDLKPVVNEVFSACVTYLSDENYIRVAHALESLAILSREIFRKRFTQQGVTITLLLAGSADNADSFFKRLISSVGVLLSRETVPVLVKSLGLRLFLIILTATDNVNSNPITSYFISNDIMEPLICTLSVKLTADRKKLEADAVFVLVLLLQWRESENVYVSKLASPTAPLQPLLNTILSLFSSPSTATMLNSSSSGWELENMISYMSSLLGWTTTDNSTGYRVAETGESCKRTCGLMLLYFLVYHNPAFKTNQVWPPVADYVPAQVTVPVQSLSSLWKTIFKSFMSLCQDETLTSKSSNTEKTLQAKVALTILRCILETPAAIDYLWHCDADWSLGKSTTGLPFRSLASVIVDNAVNVLATLSDDADLMYRACVLVPLALKHVKAQAWHLQASSLNAQALWSALIGCCARYGDINTFQKPGVKEAVELLAGTLEWLLAVSLDIFVAAEETEALHATVMCYTDALEQLMESSANKQLLVNTSAIKFHYEIQIAALGVRSKPTFQQALTGVKKKGLASLKLKPRHAGPGRIYIEGTRDTQLLNSLTRLVLNLHKKHMYEIPKLENEGM